MIFAQHHLFRSLHIAAFTYLVRHFNALCSQGLVEVAAVQGGVSLLSAQEWYAHATVQIISTRTACALECLLDRANLDGT